MIKAISIIAYSMNSTIKEYPYLILTTGNLKDTFNDIRQFIKKEKFTNFSMAIVCENGICKCRKFIKKENN